MGGESKTISYTIEGATENTVVKAIAQDGWKVKVDATSTDKGTITITAPDPIVESEILVFVNDGSYRTVMASLNCSQKMVIIIADNSFNVSPDGGTQEVKLTTNLNYTVEIPENAKSWLSISPFTRVMREDTITFYITANEGTQRYATVVLKDEQDNTLQTIIFRQLGTCTEVHVETKGELENVLADYDYANIKSLKITGVLNDIDFLFMHRMMPHLRNLDISEVNISNLPAQSFYKSSNIQTIILPTTLTAIGANTFNQSRLQAIIIPPNVETIETSAFQNCRSLTNISFEDNSNLKSIGDFSFSGCTSLVSIEIPTSVVIIGNSAFKNCISLVDNTFTQESCLHRIQDHAYEGCVALSTITIPASVQAIGLAAFKKCANLKEVKFESHSELTEIIGPDYHINYGQDNDGAFTGCSSLTAISIPASVKIIGPYAFHDCVALNTVIFEHESQLNLIDDYAFLDCSSLISIEIPANVEKIGYSAFKDCHSLACVQFEKGSKLKKLDGSYGTGELGVFCDGVFENCTSLSSIEIPASVEKIGCATFKNCTTLASVVFEPQSKLKIIGGSYHVIPYTSSHYFGVFADCAALSQIRIPASVERIECCAFQNCTALTSVTFEDNSNLIKIASDYVYLAKENLFYGAFSGCSQLLTIDASACTKLASIGKFAFYNASQLYLFKIGAATPPKCYNDFSEINSFSVLKVPSNSIDAYKAADNWKYFASITGLDE